MRTAWVILLVAAVCWLVGCGQPRTTAVRPATAPARGEAAESAVESAPDTGISLLVPCGAGLQPAMDEIGAAWTRKSGVRVDFSYAGSGMLMAQLELSKAGDLYMPGEAFWVTLAERKGLVKETRPVVWFTPVLAVPKGNPAGVRGIADLAKPGMRVALGDPEALAIGPVSKRILDRAGIWEATRANVVMFAGCIPELANCLAMNGAEVALLWDAVAAQHGDKMDTVAVEPEFNEVAEVMVSTLTCSAHPAEAQAFLEFVVGDEAEAIFARTGFQTHAPEGIRIAPREGPDA